MVESLAIVDVDPEACCVCEPATDTMGIWCVDAKARMEETE